MKLPLVPRCMLTELQARYDKRWHELNRALERNGELRRVCSSLDLQNAELRRRVRELTERPSW